MFAAAENLEFEKAARIRDELKTLERAQAAALRQAGVRGRAAARPGRQPDAGAESTSGASLRQFAPGVRDLVQTRR